MFQNILYCLVIMVIKCLCLWDHTAKLSSLGLINLLHNWRSDREICCCAQVHPRQLATGLGSCSRCTALGWSGRWWALDPKCSCGTDWPSSSEDHKSTQDKYHEWLRSSLCHPKQALLQIRKENSFSMYICDCSIKHDACCSWRSDDTI